MLDPRIARGISGTAHEGRGALVDDSLVHEVIVAVPAGVMVLVDVDQQEHPVVARMRHVLVHRELDF